ncbi:MAG: DoxX family membrane protein [Phycisphaerales bacterium]|nr:DoxX family membrane protein [Phycisphaerales bacterium]
MPRQSTGLRLLLLLLRLALGGLFLFAAYSKWEDPQKFIFAVKGFKILPDHLAVLATYAVPWTEAIASVLLILGIWARASAATIALMLLGFIAGILSVIQRGIDVKCTCFGGYELLCTGSVGWCNIAQNAVLLAAALLIAIKGGGLLSVERRA